MSPPNVLMLFLRFWKNATYTTKNIVAQISRERTGYMYNLRQAKGFQGVDLVLSEDELNALIEQIDRITEQFKPNDELDETVDKLRSLKSVFCDYAYFDENEREVHCRMGFYELQLMIETIIIALPKAKVNVFEQLLNNPTTKRWSYKSTNNDNQL